MNFVEQLSAITLLIDFLLGVWIGVVGSATHGSRREDRRYSLLHAAPDPVCDGARVIHGVYARGGGFVTGTFRGGSDGVTPEADPEVPGGLGNRNAPGPGQDR